MFHSLILGILWWVVQNALLLSLSQIIVRKLVIRGHRILFLSILHGAVPMLEKSRSHHGET